MGTNFGSMLGEEEIDNLFMEPEEEKTEERDGTERSDEEASEEKEKNKTTEDVDPEDLFEEEEKQPESVGSEKKEKEKGDSITDDGGGASPNENFYSSIANAMAEDGIFPNLTEETLKGVVDAETLSEAIEAEVNARFDEKQQRIAKALENGVEPTDIRKYENTLNYIASITEQALNEESEKGENLRKGLIYQDFLNKGYTPEKAQKFTERSIEQGNDVEDAKEALLSNKEYFQREYDRLLREAQEEADAEKEERQKQAAKLKDSILKDKTLLGDMELSADIRKKAYETISNPVYRDPETGEYMTALQKYQTENKADFLKYVGLIMTLTNNFKDFDSFVKGKVKKAEKKGLKQLEQVINGTRRNQDGSLKLVTGVNDDPESYSGLGFKLDL